MKTKIRTFITVCALALTGLNAGATANYINLNTNVAFAEEKNVKNLKADENMTVLNGKTETIENEATENFGDVIDFQKEAQLITKEIADREEAKTIQLLIDKNIVGSDVVYNSNNGDVLNENNGDREEAQFVTKLLADKEEAKAIQKLVDEGKLSENK
jgi:hypothetical protein